MLSRLAVVILGTCLPVAEGVLKVCVLQSILQHKVVFLCV